MAWTQDDIDALKSSIATGVRDVTYSDGSRMVYRSLDEMRAVLRMMKNEVAGSSVKRTRMLRLASGKGF